MSGRDTELADRIELAELVARETHWLDEHRTDGAERFFTEDVVARTPGGEATGRESLAAMARSQHGKYERTHHLPTGIVVDLDGDGADMRFSANIALVEHGGAVVLCTARYRAGARRTGDGWRIARLDIEQTSKLELPAPGR